MGWSELPYGNQCSVKVAVPWRGSPAAAIVIDQRLLVVEDALECQQ